MKLKSRKLLSAAIGVATVSYVVACGDARTGTETSGNLPAPPPGGAGGTAGTAGTAGGGTGGLFPTVGNLPVPPPGGFPNVAGTAGVAGTPTQVDAGDDPTDAVASDAAPTDGSADAMPPANSDSDLSDASD
jgi:hypothetical protein